jgi:hypothetical protein
MNILGLPWSVRIPHITCYCKFLLLHYIQVLCQSRHCRADHVYSTYLMLQRQFSHWNGRKLDRRQVYASDSNKMPHLWICCRFQIWNCNACKRSLSAPLVNFPRFTSVRELRMASQVPHIYDYKTKLCKQAEVNTKSRIWKCSRHKKIWDLSLAAIKLWLKWLGSRCNISYMS